MLSALLNTTKIYSPEIFSAMFQFMFCLSFRFSLLLLSTYINTLTHPSLCFIHVPLDRCVSETVHVCMYVCFIKHFWSKISEEVKNEKKIHNTHRILANRTKKESNVVNVSHSTQKKRTFSSCYLSGTNFSQHTSHS